MPSALQLMVILSCAVIGCGTTDRRRVGNAAAGSGAGGSQTQAGAGSAGLELSPPGETPPEEGGADCSDTSGSLGCSFYSVRPPRRSAAASASVNGACFAAFVVNASAVTVDIQVEHDGELLDTQKLARIPRGSGASIRYEPLPGGRLPPSEVAILFLTQSVQASQPCPSDVGYERKLALSDLTTGSGYEKAFHITTSAPVAAYDIFPYGGGASAVSSASLLLPTTVWDTNYVAVGSYAGTAVVQLVAAEDDTEITLAPRANIQPGPGVAGGAANQLQTYRLMRGDVLQLAPELGQEISGSPLLASKPVGLWGASDCAQIPSEVEACDSLHQQIPPVPALGSRYVALRHRDRFDERPEQAPFRLVGAVDGTELSYSADAPAGAPSSLQAGEVVEIRADLPFSVESQDAEHPFYLATYMTGCEETQDAIPSLADCRGDPEFVNVVPTEQYSSAYTFFTDPTYPETSLALVRKRKDGVFADVELDCLGTISGWQSVRGNPDYEFSRVDLVRGNFEPQAGCDNGRHEAKSDAPFALTVWGWGSALTGGTGLKDPGYSQCVSYAYPAGAGVRRISTTTVPPVVK